MARLKKAITGFLWASFAVPVMAVCLAIAVLFDYMESDR